MRVRAFCAKAVSSFVSFLKWQTGVFFSLRMNGKVGWDKGGDEKKDCKYVGEIKNYKTKGHGTLTIP